MIRTEELIQQLIDAFADRGDLQNAESRLVVHGLDLDLPIETRIASDGALLMTLPRGVLATGFQLPVGRLRLHCVEPL